VGPLPRWLMAMTLNILLVSAVGIGFLHTLIGVDHSLPFIVLGRAHGWSLRRVLGVTALCGLGHVLSSVVLGIVGVTLGWAVADLEWIDGGRGNLAAWLLIVLGLAYAGWSFARQRRSQRHLHRHADGTVHAHEYPGAHSHGSVSPATVTAWGLFVVFVLGPCEPLIPMLMVPAVDVGVAAITLVVLAFGLTTIGTMLLMVTVGYLGLSLPVFRRCEAHAHTIAGLAIAGSGLAIELLGI
jgi:nickel/cobalt exporter